jgi:hypothetical protein
VPPTVRGTADAMEAAECTCEQENHAMGTCDAWWGTCATPRGEATLWCQSRPTSTTLYQYIELYVFLPVKTQQKKKIIIPTTHSPATATPATKYPGFAEDLEVKFGLASPKTHTPPPSCPCLAIPVDESSYRGYICYCTELGPVSAGCAKEPEVKFGLAYYKAVLAALSVSSAPHRRV